MQFRSRYERWQVIALI